MSSDFNIDRFCRILAHQAPDAVIYADSRGVIRFWNAGAERIFEFSAAEATGKSLDIIIPENLRARHWAGFDQTMRTGKTRYGAGDILAVPALRKDRMRISIEFTVLPFHDETDHMLGIVAILRDVTKRFEEMKELRRQLAKSSRLAATSVIGAIRVSGGSASQDQAVATAGLASGGKPSAARPATHRFRLPTAPVVGEACCHGTPQKKMIALAGPRIRGVSAQASECCRKLFDQTGITDRGAGGMRATISWIAEIEEIALTSVSDGRGERSTDRRRDCGGD